MSNPFLSSFTNALMNALEQRGPSVANGARSFAATRPRGTADAEPGPCAQPVDPAIAWDWPEVGPSRISLQQWNFCDTQPASEAAGQQFASGSGSFSGAYRSLLELVDATKFVPPSMLTEARQAAAMPTSAPGDGVGPQGFIVVANSGGVYQFEPEWRVSMTPTQWAIDQSSGFRFDATALSGLFAGTPQIAALDGARRDATLTVSNPARVMVYAGDWYSDEFVRLVANGPFVGARPAQEVVGPSGILRCRITEFLVGSEFVVTATFDDADARALVTQLADAPTARIGTVAAADANVQLNRVAGGTRVVATTSPGKPFIVTVSVQPVAS
jgi:hypothetical protein